MHQNSISCTRFHTHALCALHIYTHWKVIADRVMYTSEYHKYLFCYYFTFLVGAKKNNKLLNQSSVFGQARHEFSLQELL
jgi:hypothetical protein